MNKGQLMKKIYTERELRNIDAAIPQEYWNSHETYYHVMNYNVENSEAFGKLEDMRIIAAERLIPINYLVPICVIDLSVNGVFIYDVDKDWDNETVTNFLYKQGRKESNCVWGAFDGEIIDLRDDQD